MTTCAYNIWLLNNSGCFCTGSEKGLEELSEMRIPARKAFLNSAEYEIKRIEKLKSEINEKVFQTEIEYLRFLERQIKMITEEIRLNKLRDNQQLNEIRYYTSQHARLKDWKDTRSSKSPSNYHNIDYHKLFEEQK